MGSLFRYVIIDPNPNYRHMKICLQNCFCVLISNLIYDLSLSDKISFYLYYPPPFFSPFNIIFITFYLFMNIIDAQFEKVREYIEI